MADEFNNVKIEVGGDISKPADTFINKLASAANLIYAPIHTRLMAQANADALLIEAKAELAVADLKRRAASRVMLEEMQNQANMESIADKAFPLLTDKADASKVDDDWMANFFAKGRTISNDEMQQLWGKLLAAEVNEPGAFSRKTVNLLQDLDYEDAELFSIVCCFFVGGVDNPVVFYDKEEFKFNWNSEIFEQNGLTFSVLTHLDDIGLISFKPNGGFQINNNESRILDLSYLGQKFRVNIPHDGLNIGNVIFTQVGHQLSRIVQIEEVPGFYDYLRRRWHLIRKPETLQSVDDAS